MRRPTRLVVLLLAALGGLLLLVFRVSDPAGLENTETRPEPDRESTALDEPQAKPELSLEMPDEVAPRRTEAADAETELDVEESTGHPRSLIFGKVIDVRETPIEGAHVVLWSNGRWVSEDLHPAELPSFEATTDSGGSFRIDTPLTTSDFVVLSVRPSDFYTLASRHFGSMDLRPGDNDLGNFIVGDAGAFEGRVVNADAVPVAGVHVGLFDVYPGGQSPSAETEQDGTYRIGSVPEGSYTAEVLATGFLTKRVGIVEVKNGEVTSGVDFRLERAPTISGRVLDTNGQPLENVRVRGRLSSAMVGMVGVMARTAADGTFALYLREHRPYTLFAELRGYEKFDGRHGNHVEPGTGDVEIVLRRPELTLYEVLDGMTGEAVERFGLKIIRARTESGSGASSAHREPAAVAHHPGGSVELPGEPRYDDYTIVAPGYAPERGRVEHDHEGTASQTIQLTPAGVLTARFVLDGEALPYPTLRVEADVISLEPGAEDDKSGEKDVDEFAGAKRQHRGDRSGALRIEDLAPGTYRLQLSAPGVAPLAVRRVRIESGQTTELGALEAPRQSEIHGTIVLPGGLSPAGISVVRGGFGGGKTEIQVADVSGRFAFKGLAEGEYSLHFQEKAGVVVNGSIEVSLGRGEVKTVQLDLSEYVPCRLDVQVLIAGEAVEDLTVLARFPDEGGSGVVLVGSTNEAGLVTRYVKAQNDVLLEVRSAGGLLLGVSATSMDLPAGGRELVDLAFDAGRLSVTLADQVGTTGIPARSLGIRRIDVEGPWSYPPSRWSLVGEELRADLGWIAPGKYSVALFLKRGAKQLEGEVRVSEGENALCRLQAD